MRTRSHRFNCGQGYLLANIVDASMQFQASAKSHPDPIHVTAHFLHSTAAAPFHVRVRVQKRGKGFTNLEAELQQNVRVSLFFWKRLSLIY